MNARKALSPPKLLAQAVLLVSTLIMFAPLYLTVVNVFKSTPEITVNPFKLPARFSFDNFVAVFTTPNVDIGRMFLNSVVITFCSVLLVLLVAPIASYYIARNKKIGNALFIYFMLSIIVPHELRLVPLVKLFHSIHLLGTLPGLILFYLGSHLPLAIFLYTGFIRTVPVEIEESADMDGAGKWTIFRKIVFPLLKPITATVIIFKSMGIWNDFLNPLILMQGSVKGYTITLGIFAGIGPYGSNWGFVFAFVVIASAPILLLYFFMQKQFISGLTAGALKG